MGLGLGLGSGIGSHSSAQVGIRFWARVDEVLGLGEVGFGIGYRESI